MARIRPSLVMDAIDAMFGPDRNELNSDVIKFTHAAEVHTLLGMIDEIPTELLILVPNDLLELNRCRATLALTARLWEQGFVEMSARQVGGRDPIERIRRLLATCPDQLPPEVALPFVRDLEVRNGLEELVKTAWTNYRIAEWVGATVFAGTAIEALLLWLVRTRETPQAPIDPGQDPLNQLSFEKLVNRVAKEKWLDDSTIGQIRHGQVARNLIHPGKSIRLRRTCSKATALTAFAAFYAMVEDLGMRMASQGNGSGIDQGT